MRSSFSLANKNRCHEPWGDFMLRENFIIMKDLQNSNLGLCFLRGNNAVNDITQSILTFSYLSMQLKPDTQLTMCQTTPQFAENTYTLQRGEPSQ